jgi:hypothetical protein
MLGSPYRSCLFQISTLPLMNHHQDEPAEIHRQIHAGKFQAHLQDYPLEPRMKRACLYTA